MLNSIDIERDYRTMTCREMAVKYGVSHDMMRKYVSDLGIRDPKASNIAKDRTLAIRFRDRYGWSVDEIADQLQRSRRFVNKALRSVRRWVQLAMWPDTAYRVPAPPMRIVHRCAGKRLAAAVQLCLDLFNDQQQLRAA